jgi:adenylate cyclase
VDPVTATSAIMEDFERESLRRAFLARPIIAGALAVVLTACFGRSSGLSTLLIGAGVTLLGWIEYKAGAGPRGQIARFGLVALEVALMTAAIFFGDLFDGNPRPPAPMIFYSPAVLFLLCVLALNAITARPLIVWWAGVCTLAAWFVAGRLTLSDPLTQTKEHHDLGPGDSLLDFLRVSTWPHFFNLDAFTLSLIAIACCTVVLAIAAHRTRALAGKAVERHAVRSGLAAHFSGPVVDALLAARAAHDQAPRTVTVLDCDLIGFSDRARRMTPDAVASALRAYHGFVEGQVFEHGGGVLKFTGDGVTAIFGMTGDAEAAASSAIACAEAIARSWPATARTAFPGEAVAIAVGVDAGTVVAGLAGEGRAMSLVVAGAPIEGAQALQQATRETGAGLLISAAAVTLAAGADPAVRQGLKPISAAGREAFTPGET